MFPGGGVNFGGIVPRPGDGRISRADAARLARVDADTISAWISKGRLKDVRREGRRVWLSPREVIEYEHKAHEAERKRFTKLIGAADPDEAVA